METELKGKVSKDKNIRINWKWEYEEDKTKDIQDTKDGENLKRFDFEIYVIGKQ